MRARLARRLIADPPDVFVGIDAPDFNLGLEKALKKRHQKLGKRVWECNTRIVWVYDRVHKGDTITAKSFDTWAPGEKIPEGDRVPDGD